MSMAVTDDEVVLDDDNHVLLGEHLHALDEAAVLVVGHFEEEPSVDEEVVHVLVAVVVEVEELGEDCPAEYAVHPGLGSLTYARVLGNLECANLVVLVLVYRLVANLHEGLVDLGTAGDGIVLHRAFDVLLPVQVGLVLGNRVVDGFRVVVLVGNPY